MPLTTPIRLTSGVAVKVVDAATATGVAKAQQFTLPEGVNNLLINAVETAITVLTVRLEVSLDNGTTFSAFQAATDFADGALASLKIEGVVGGSPIYQINIITITGTNVSFWVACGHFS